MAAAKRNIKEPPALTIEERRFVVRVLRGINLNGNYAALSQAVEMIDSIIGKLGEELQEQESNKKPHLLP